MNDHTLCCSASLFVHLLWRPRCILHNTLTPSRLSINILPLVLVASPSSSQSQFNFREQHPHHLIENRFKRKHIHIQKQNYKAYRKKMQDQFLCDMMINSERKLSLPIRDAPMALRSCLYQNQKSTGISIFSSPFAFCAFLHGCVVVLR
ncbi:unnamed protein product [Vicia faba]|uniref:Uncharacterized protein n=1 Tax=Vicia faba TaxID=3906 RepID=A0AAV1B7M7_VICFA|nr:unnamed protein product [Vicia faba]